MMSHDGFSDEETPLLQRKSKTPLPWSQISLVFIALIAEPVSSGYIFPFINQVGQQFFLISDANAWLSCVENSSSANLVSREETFARLVIMRASSYARIHSEMLLNSSLRRNPSFSLPRHSRRGSGADCLISSGAAPSFYLVSSVSVCPTLPLVCRGPWARSLSGKIINSSSEH